MQTHQDIWFSVSNEIEHIYFRAHHLPTPVLDFIPWPIRVRGIIFPDDSEITSTGSAQTPWLQNIDGAGYTLNNANFTNVTVNGRPLTNVFELKGSVPTQDDLPSNASMGDVWITQDTGFLYVWDGIQWVDLGPAGSSFQTPWLSNIDADGFSLSNAGGVGFPDGTTIRGATGTGNILVNCNFLGLNVGLPAFTLDVGGDINSRGCYYVGNVEFACANGAGGVNLTNISTINGAAPGSQTPWLSDIDADGFFLRNLGYLSISGPSGGIALDAPGSVSITLSTDSFATFYSVRTNSAQGAFVINNQANNGLTLTAQGWMSVGGQVRLPQYPLDVQGDVNCTGEYLVNGVPISTGAFDPQAHDVTGIRSAVTQYGPFPQARFVSVFFQLIGASDNAFLNLLLPGQTIAIAVAGTGTGAEPQTGFLFGLVPAGAIYVVDTAMAITTWVEYY